MPVLSWGERGRFLQCEAVLADRDEMVQQGVCSLPSRSSSMILRAHSRPAKLAFRRSLSCAV